MRAAAWSILIAAAALTPACNIVAPAFVLVHGPPRVPKVHTLDPERTTVLFIDDPGNRLPRRQLRVVMGQEAEQRMLAKGVVESGKEGSNLISGQSAIAVADQEQFGERKTIADIGRAIGADVVVWVTVDSFALSPDGESMAPAARVRTRVVDSAADAVIWPPEREGYPMTVNLPTKSAALPTSRAQARELEVALAQYAGQAIAEQFYSVEKPVSARAGEKSLRSR